LQEVLEGTMKAVGIDIVDIERVRRMYRRWGKRLLSRVLTEEERTYCLSKPDAAESVAVRIAAKEAFYKAGRLRGSLPWKQIEVQGAGRGRAPELRLRGGLGRGFAGSTLLLSLSHSRTSAVAVVIVD